MVGDSSVEQIMLLYSGSISEGIHLTKWPDGWKFFQNFHSPYNIELESNMEMRMACLVNVWTANNAPGSLAEMEDHNGTR